MGSSNPLCRKPGDISNLLWICKSVLFHRCNPKVVSKSAGISSPSFPSPNLSLFSILYLIMQDQLGKIYGVLVCPGGSGVEILKFPNEHFLTGWCSGLAWFYANSSNQQPSSGSALTFLSHNYTSSSVGPLQSVLLRAGCFNPSLWILPALIIRSYISHNISVKNMFLGWVLRIRSDTERKPCTCLFLNLLSATVTFCG